MIPIEDPKRFTEAIKKFINSWDHNNLIYLNLVILRWKEQKPLPSWPTFLINYPVSPLYLKLAKSILPSSQCTSARPV